MSSISLRVVAATSMAFLALAGCEEMAGTPGPTGEPVPTGEQAPQTVIQEVERSDIFGATELALWDGRPSLGGIWVAHPDVKDPERVRIRNTTNGQTISGALFRRERTNPGPRIQVSSDAAAALGLLAGQPTELEVIVLRTEEIVIEPEPVPEPVVEPGTEGDAGDADVAEEASVPEPVETADAAEPIAVFAGGADAAANDGEPKQKGFWARFRDSLRNDPAPAVEEIGTATVLTDTATDASTPDVEIAPLDPIAVAAAAIDEAEAEDTADLQTDATEVASATAIAPAPSSGLKNPFIQIGLFGEQANATAASTALRQAGIVPTVAEGRNGNGPFWRVLVGPVTTAEDQAELLAQVRSMGYSDAYLTPN